MRSLRHRVAAVLSTALVAMRLLAPEAFSPCASWHGVDERVAEPLHHAPAPAPHAHGAMADDAHTAHEHVADASADAPVDSPACPHCQGSDCCCVAPALDQRAAATVPEGTVDLARERPHAARNATLRTRVAFLLPFATAPPALS